MLTEYQSGGKTLWVDLHNPRDQEIAQVCAKYGLDISPRGQLEDIAFSSRLLHRDANMLFRDHGP